MAVALVGNLVDDGDIKSKLRAQCLEDGGISFPALAEVEIIARHHMPGGHVLDEIFFDEGWWFKVGE